MRRSTRPRQLCRNYRKSKKHFVRAEQIDVELIEEVSRALTQATLDWWESFRRNRDDKEGLYLSEEWVRVLFEECDDDFEKQVYDLIFRGWGENVLPTLVQGWEDGEAEGIAEAVYYKIVKEYRSFHLEAESGVQANRLRAFRRPHRPAKFGHATVVKDDTKLDVLCVGIWMRMVGTRGVSGSNGTISARAGDADVERCNTPPYVSGRAPFSGRRRRHDFHDAIMELTKNLACDVKVISLDTAVDSHYGDLSSDSFSWAAVMKLARQCRISAAVAGPPCETYSEARFHIPEGLSEEDRQKWPRQLRTEDCPWGIDGLRYREMKQLQIGSRFGLQTIWLFVLMLCTGGCMLV